LYRLRITGATSTPFHKPWCSAQRQPYLDLLPIPQLAVINLFTLPNEANCP
jgi:hypothetical protein